MKLTFGSLLRKNFNQTYRTQQLHRTYLAARKNISIDDTASTDIFPALLAQTWSDPMFEPIFDKMMAMAQFNEASFVDIRLFLMRSLRFYSNKMKTGFYAPKYPTTKAV